MTTTSMTGVDQGALPLGLKTIEEIIHPITVSRPSVHFPYHKKQVHRRIQELCLKEVHVVQKREKVYSRKIKVHFMAQWHHGELDRESGHHRE